MTGDFRQAKTLIDGSRIPLRNKAVFAEETVWQVFQVEVQYSQCPPGLRCQLPLRLQRKEQATLQYK